MSYVSEQTNALQGTRIGVANTLIMINQLIALNWQATWKEHFSINIE